MSLKITKKSLLNHIFILGLGLSFGATAKPISSQNILDFAIAQGWRGYTYPRSVGGRGLVLASERGESRIEFPKIHARSTISFLYRRDIFHAYVRIGDVLFDEWGGSPKNDIPEAHDRRYSDVMKKSQEKRWMEILFRIDEEDLALLQQFYFYRFIITQDAGKIYGQRKNLPYTNPWMRDFRERGFPPFVEKENCTGWVLAPFNEQMYKSNPTAAQMESVHARAKKIAATYGVSFKHKDWDKFLAEAKKLPKKYKIEMVAAPPGMMRMANLHPRLLAFVVHNVDQKENFLSKNNMGFDAKYGGNQPIDKGFDKKVSERSPIKSDPNFGTKPSPKNCEDGLS
jgi:hypothetical protein